MNRSGHKNRDLPTNSVGLPKRFKFSWAWEFVLVSVDPEDVKTVTADDRGRVYLGTEYAKETVEVAILGEDD